MLLLRLTGLFILLASVNVVNAQQSTEHLDTVVKKYVIELKNKNIDTVCIYQDYCIGCTRKWKKNEDKCNFEGLFIPTYIFWVDKGQTFMTKKDNCFDYSVIKIPGDSIWTTFFKNQDIIKKETLKIPQYIEIKNGKEEIYSSYINHSYQQGIKIIVGTDTIIDKNIDDYYLTPKIIFTEKENINYLYNINSKLKNFQLLIDRIIEGALKINTLTKRKR